MYISAAMHKTAEENKKIYISWKPRQNVLKIQSLWEKLFWKQSDDAAQMSSLNQMSLPHFKCHLEANLILSPGIRVTVAESLIRDIARVSEWCDLWWMKLNESKNKTMIVSRSMHPQSPPLTIGVTVLKQSDDLVILRVTFDSKMTFEQHLRSASKAASLLGFQSSIIARLPKQLLKDLVTWGSVGEG